MKGLSAVAFKLPRTPLKYVLPGVLGILDNREGIGGFYDLLRLHPQEWLFAAEREGDERLKHLLAEYRNHARLGMYLVEPLEGICQVSQYEGLLPHTYKPLYVSRLDVMALLRRIESLHPEGSVIRESAQKMASRVEGLPVELYKDDPILVNAYLDSNLYVDPELPVKGGRSYEARVELQNLLTAEVIGDEYDYHT